MTERVLLWVGRLLLPLAVLAGIGALSRLELGEPPRHGVLRLAWRMLGAKARVCREYTEEERRSIPRHMLGLGQTCEQTILTYRLRLWVDGQARLDLAVAPRGLRGDRPLFVQEDFPLAPGAHPIRLQFEPLEPAAAATKAADASDAEQAALLQALQEAPRYTLEREVTLQAGRILLIDLDERGRKFVILSQ